MAGADCRGAGCRNKLVPSLAPSRSSSLSTSSIASKICLLVDSHKSHTCLLFFFLQKVHFVMVRLQNLLLKNCIFEQSVI